MNRRGFLSFLGVAPVALPLAMQIQNASSEPYLYGPLEPIAGTVTPIDVLAAEAYADFSHDYSLPVAAFRMYSDEGILRQQSIPLREFYVSAEDERRPPAQDLQQALPHQRT